MFFFFLFWFDMRTAILFIQPYCHLVQSPLPHYFTMNELRICPTVLFSFQNVLLCFSRPCETSRTRNFLYWKEVRGTLSMNIFVKILSVYSTVFYYTSIVSFQINSETFVTHIINRELITLHNPMKQLTK
jgi:hypothetical protein